MVNFSTKCLQIFDNLFLTPDIYEDLYQSKDENLKLSVLKEIHVKKQLMMIDKREMDGNPYLILGELSVSMKQ